MIASSFVNGDTLLYVSVMILGLLLAGGSGGVILWLAKQFSMTHKTIDDVVPLLPKLELLCEVFAGNTGTDGSRPVKPLLQQLDDNTAQIESIKLELRAVNISLNDIKSQVMPNGGRSMADNVKVTRDLMERK